MENTTLRNCLVPFCDGQHFINFKNSKAVITASDFFEICRHFTKNVHDICGFECSSNVPCNNHKKLNVLKHTENYYRNKNINSDIVISKIQIRICDHPYCFKNWCFRIYETKYVGYECSIKYRSNFL